jgi:hypothetical protein
LGILGTLLAAGVSQWVAWRREEVRWRRERGQDEKRWERELAREEARWNRERQERVEQWQREDHARLFQSRVVAYQSLLKAADDLVRSYDSEVFGWPQSGPGLVDAYQAFRHANADIEVIGLPAVRRSSLRLWQKSNNIMLALPADATTVDKESGVRWSIELHNYLGALQGEIQREVGTASDGKASQIDAANLLETFEILLKERKDLVGMLSTAWGPNVVDEIKSSLSRLEDLIPESPDRSFIEELMNRGGQKEARKAPDGPQ